MISPAQQWCVQIDVTNHCTRACSNCTRMLAHVPPTERFHMSLEAFAQAVESLALFPSTSPPDPARRQKVVGLIGGEPLLHPHFPVLCQLLADAIPNPRERGLWTGLAEAHPLRIAHRGIIDRTFPKGIAYRNPNDHTTTVMHHPVLVAPKDVVDCEETLWQMVMNCPLQEHWSSTITPRGFFFCEVAGAMDMIFQGKGTATGLRDS